MFKNFKKESDDDTASPFDRQEMPNWNAASPLGEPELPAENLFPGTPVSPVFEPVPEAPAPISAGGSARNVLNSDVSVNGTLRFTDDLLIDGTVEGEIFSDGVLTVGTNASIQAEIKTKSAIIHGKVTGNVTVTDRVELSSTAELVGDIVASTLAVQAGAVFIGRSTVGNVAGMNLSPAAEKKSGKKQLDKAPDLLA